MNPFIETITNPDPSLRNRSLSEIAESLPFAELYEYCRELEAFRRSSANLYERVRACMFQFALYRFYLMESDSVPRAGYIPYRAFEDLLDRRFEEALERLFDTVKRNGPNGTLFSGIAQCYRDLAFETLTAQVRRSVRASRGNQWMFRVGYAGEHAVRFRSELTHRPTGSLLYPILCEKTPVRLDLSHSGWSDIFFLGMDYPEGARVLNISVNLGIHGRDAVPAPPD